MKINLSIQDSKLKIELGDSVELVMPLNEARRFHRMLSVRLSNAPTSPGPCGLADEPAPDTCLWRYADGLEQSVTDSVVLALVREVERLRAEVYLPILCYVCRRNRLLFLDGAVRCEKCGVDAETINHVLEKKQADTCLWDWYARGLFITTACGHDLDTGPDSNASDFLFCPHCGKTPLRKES